MKLRSAIVVGLTGILLSSCATNDSNINIIREGDKLFHVEYNEDGTESRRYQVTYSERWQRYSMLLEKGIRE